MGDRWILALHDTPSMLSMALTLADLESEGNACPESCALRNGKCYISGCEKYWKLAL